jgi:hypothetical protein
MQSNAPTTFRRQLQIDRGKRADANTSKACGPARPASDLVTLKAYERALAEARRKLVHPEAYEVGDWHWGFRDLAGRAELEELSPVYQFVFAPLATVDRTAHPPQVVEVRGEDAPQAARPTAGERAAESNG